MFEGALPLRGYTLARTSHGLLLTCPKAANGTNFGIEGPDAYTARARAHSLSSWVPFGCVNFVCPVCVCSYLSTLISLISSESYGIFISPFSMVLFRRP